MENANAEWCDGVSQCGREEIKRLSDLLVTVQALSSSSGASAAACDAVTAALDCLERCGSIVVQSMSVVAGDAGSSSSGSSVLGALESLRGLSEERLSAVCADEAAAFDVVRDHVGGLVDCFGDDFVSGCMALHTLGCRNGVSLCGRAEVVEESCGMLSKWYEYASGDGRNYVAGAACGAYFVLVGWYGVPKVPPELRGPVERSFQAGVSSPVQAAKSFTEADVRQLYIDSTKAGVMGHEDLSLACG
eukprot:SAG22_NODE_7426_length_741_cov_0.904984_1_plen_246_part_11